MKAIILAVAMINISMYAGTLTVGDLAMKDVELPTNKNNTLTITPSSTDYPAHPGQLA